MRKRLGELLVETGHVSEPQVRAALGHQRAHGNTQRLGALLVSMGSVRPVAVARALATQFQLPFVELPKIPPAVTRLLPVAFQTQHRIVPFKLEVDGRSERLHVAVEDPANLELVDKLRFQLNKTVKVYVAALDDLERTLASLRGEVADVVAPLAFDEEAGADLELKLEKPANLVAGGRYGQVPVAAARPAPAASAAMPPVVTGAPAVVAQRRSTVADDLDDLLGLPSAAAGQGPGRPAHTSRLVLDEAERRTLADLERLANGEAPLSQADAAGMARRVADLLRLLIRKGVIDQRELLQELSRK